MRITFLAPDFRAGGAERAVAVMSAYWCARGHALTILTLDDGASPPFFRLPPEAQHLPLDVLYPSTGPLSMLQNAVRRNTRIRRNILQSRPDVVVSVIDSINVRAILATRHTGLPVIVSERTDPALHEISRAWRLARLLSYPLADALVVQTEAAREHFPLAIRQRTVVIPNPVPPPDAPLPEGERPRRIVCVSRLSPEKDVGMLIRAFGRISPAFPDWLLTLVGGGDQFEDLSRLAEELGLAEKVEFVGWQQDVGVWLRQASVFALPSRYEGFPNALCEALAQGLPAVATATTGARGVLHEGTDGLLVPVGDETALANALETLLSNQNLRRSMGLNAKKVLDRFGQDQVMAAWDSLLTEAIKRRSVRG